ncbi:Probable tyrosyl-DNA phosphodiesterase [Eumeta japonica]|uniref:Probable tyrosyl-DNA phosphodiesterase n=1 Tax=Eumeta variegata TaxID=151549 RepID=A0A4C1WMY1_EUMVA|nr:Probable tyrosyl-DNA phosphodiesterase [Eumeta japonica]
MGLDQNDHKRVKKECSYGEKCYRRNPAHFREFSHAHLESILDEYPGTGDFPIPDKFRLERRAIGEQLQIILEKKLYDPGKALNTKVNEGLPADESTKTDCVENNAKDIMDRDKESLIEEGRVSKNRASRSGIKDDSIDTKADDGSSKFEVTRVGDINEGKKDSTASKQSGVASSSQVKDPDYRAIVPPTRKIQDYINVVAPKGRMLEKHQRNAPYYLFYTTITAATETHRQDNSITFQEILDPSLGELKCSLQINFMVEIGWLLGHYYFAGYSNKKLTILYGEECSDMKTITQKRPNVEAYYVNMSTPFGKHHTKMMILCYEDGSLRVVVSTANLYLDDWENRTQGLWFSPKCEELPETAMPFDGESPTGFKRSLLTYLNQYQKPQIAYYTERVKRCDFSKINVFLVASAPGGHFDYNFGLARIGSLLKQHCKIPPSENHQWALIAQASSIGSYGKQPEICEKFSQPTMGKIKAGIFDGLQIRQLTNDTQFRNSMTELELKAWTAFVSVMQNFLGNKKSENYIELVENPLLQLKNMACNMSIKLHFLHSHLDRFSENLGDMSEEQGKRMRRDLRVMEERYQGRNSLYSQTGSKHVTQYAFDSGHDMIIQAANSQQKLSKERKKTSIVYMNLWLTGDFLHNFTKIQNQSQLLAKSLPKLRLVYPSLENVRQSHDGLLGGGCLPYAAEAHTKQLWLNKFLYQWKAKTSGRDRAMPHIKSYMRISPDAKRAAYYILTSGNVSKAAWGTFNKGNGALRIMSYEAVNVLTSFVLNKDFFSLDKSDNDHLSVPYDLPPVPYEEDMSPWVMDYLR